MRALGEKGTRRLPHLLPEWMRSPKQLEALLRGYLNTWAMYGLSAADGALFDDIPDLRTDQYPVIRRFFSQEPAKSTRHLSELYEVIEAATKARRTMRRMDRTHRPEIAAEMERERENLIYSQATRANKELSAIGREIAAVMNTPSLEELHTYAQGLARERRFAGKIAKLRRGESWRDIGALKRDLIDLWLSERNAFAKG